LCITGAFSTANEKCGHFCPADPIIENEGPFVAMPKTELETIWTRACELLTGLLSKDVFDRWISVIHPLEMTDDTLSLGVANDYYSTWLEENYLPLIAKAVTSVTGRERRIAIAVDRRAAQQLQEKLADKPAAPAKGAGKSPDSSRRRAEETRLNPKYVFDTFVVGSSNNFAHAASTAVAQSPAKAYNPLFIYGGVGLGKTHLMHAIGHHQLARNPASRVCYLSCEEFTNEYIEAIKRGTLEHFRKKYRSVDMLLIDDMQFLGGKERIQEEFFHTFNALFDGHKQIVMTCDRPASEIPGLEQRLVSRFEWGLVTEMEVPDYETRVAILRKKSQQMKIAVPDEAVNFIAQRIKANVRRLEGALIKAASYASLINQPLTMASLEKILRETLDPEEERNLSMESIQRAVAEYFDIRYSDILSKKRPANIAFPRQVAMFLCRELTPHSLPSIGEAFGKNHATVLHAVNSVDAKIQANPAIRQTVSVLRHKLTGRREAATAD
jgi:chromosomal replication initiator protein